MSFRNKTNEIDTNYGCWLRDQSGSAFDNRTIHRGAAKTREPDTIHGTRHLL